MLRPELLDAIARDGSAFANACELSDLDRQVLACPDWSVRDLLWHLTQVHHFWTQVVALHATTDRPSHVLTRPADDGLLDLYRIGLTDLLGALRAADDDARVWTFTDDHSVAFVIRRVAHETAIHSWDACQAAQVDRVTDPQLCSDGIDEFLTHFIGRRSPDAAAVGGSVHLHCADVAGEWTLFPIAGEAGFQLERAHIKGDCALRGTAAELLAALWRRTPSLGAEPIGGISIVGDQHVAERFLAYASLCEPIHSP